MTRLRLTLPYLLSGVFALVYAWLLSGTAFKTTALQFVSPFAVVLLTHLAWLATFEGLTPGFALTAMRRAFATVIVIGASTVLFAALAPMPSDAASQPNSIVHTILVTIACLAVIALVMAAVAAILLAIAYAGYKLFKSIRSRRGRLGDAGETRLYDFAFAAAAVLSIGAASLEGVAGVIPMFSADLASTTVAVAASPAEVWKQVAKATSPDFPLPIMLQSIPRPIKVLVDEGAALGARRIVRFQGREGEGDLVLQVAKRSEDEALFQAKSDSSPIANWVRQNALTFRVDPSLEGSRLTVSLKYDRLLSPGWFFGPYIRTAAFLAVNVLARDTKLRAEAH